MSEFSPDTSQIQSHKDFKKTKRGWYERWDAEMQSANKRTRIWHKRGHKIIARFLDRRGESGNNTSTANVPVDHTTQMRLNLFNANIVTKRAMLYGQTPKVDVSRRFADANDDVARVSAEMLGRILNTSIEVSGDNYEAVLKNCLDDRLLPGMGVARIRYEFKTEKVEHNATMVDGQERAPAYTETKLTGESSTVDYVHWDDFRWGYGRTWEEIPWLGFRAYMTRDQVSKRFGAAAGKEVPIVQSREQREREYSDQTRNEVDDAWARAEIWEIWDKDTRCVYWYCKGYQKILDKKKDPLKLYGFFPSPKPMVANPTTNLFIPQPDFYIAQDLYNEIDRLETRINIITSAVRVVGVYDKAQEGIKRMLTEGFENDLIPVDNYAQFAEKGGLDSLVDWMPVVELVTTLEKLVDQRNDAIDLLYQVTGMADILRGASGPARETAEAAGVKGKFASIRIQALQDEFARFASDLMVLKAEIISKHFNPQSIIEQSNVERGFDAELAQPATELIQNSEETAYRVVVRPESVAMVDFAQLRNERAEYINALAMFLQSSAPLIEQEPAAAPVLTQLLKWGLAGFKGSQEIEGIIDKAIEQMQKSGPKEKDDGSAQADAMKLELEKLKHSNAMQLAETKHNQAMQMNESEFMQEIKKLKADVEANAAKEQQQADASTQETQAQTITSIEELQAEHDSAVAEIQANHDAKMAELEKAHDLKMAEIGLSNRGKDNGSAQMDSG